MTQTEIHDFNTLYLQSYRKAFIFTKSFVHDKSVAEDIVSDSLIKIWESVKRKKWEYSDALLLTVLKNKSLDYLKHEAIKTEVIQSLADSSQRDLEIRISTLQACDPEEIFSEEVKRLVSETLAALPEQTRRIFIMSRFQNKSNKEIAEELNLSVKSIEYHITKALKLLRENLKDYWLVFYFLFFLK